MDEKNHVSSTKYRKSQKSASLNLFRSRGKRTVDRCGATPRGTTVIDTSLSGGALSLTRARFAAARVSAPAPNTSQRSVIGDRLGAMAEHVRGPAPLRGTRRPQSVQGSCDVSRMLSSNCASAGTSCRRACSTRPYRYRATRTVGVERDAARERCSAPARSDRLELPESVERETIGLGFHSVRRASSCSAAR